MTTESAEVNIEQLHRLHERLNELLVENKSALEGLEANRPDPLAPLGEQQQFRDDALRLVSRQEVLSDLAQIALQ